MILFIRAINILIKRKDMTGTGNDTDMTDDLVPLFSNVRIVFYTKHTS